MLKSHLKNILTALWLASLWGGIQPKQASAQTKMPASSESACRWTQAPQIIQQSDSEVHQFWSFADAPVFWSQRLPQSPSLELFRQAAQALISDPDPKIYYRKHPPADDGEAYNKTLAVSGRAAELQPISCLEALLLSEQTARLPMLQQPSEFGAFILRQADASGAYRYRVYFSTQDRPGLRMNSQVMALIDSDRQQGWTVWAHLHNHNFFPNKSDPYASPSPSKTDIEFARMMHQGLKLEQLWVTNGFYTLHVSQQEFYLFHGHSDESAATSEYP